MFLIFILIIDIIVEFILDYHKTVIIYNIEELKIKLQHEENGINLIRSYLVTEYEVSPIMFKRNWWEISWDKRKIRESKIKEYV